MAARNVTGHIRRVQRKRGPVFYVKYRVGERQVQKLLGPAWTERGRPPAGYFTAKTAEQALQALLADARRGTLAQAGRTGRTFGDACAEWLRYVEHDKQRAPSTLADYRNVVDGHLLPELGADTPLERITTERVDSYRERLLADGHLSRRSVQKVMVLLYGILKRAKRRKWIASNPAEDVERVTVRRSGDFNVLSPVEVEAVAAVAESEQDAAVFTVAAFTGLRLGELRALRWQDVNFANATVIVRASYTRSTEGKPKSGKLRSVPLIDQAARALDGLSRRELFTAPGDLVFCSPVGRYCADGELRDRFYDALRAAGLGHLRTKPDPLVFHDLRHSFGTLAVRIWTLPDVQAFMGHADIQTTMLYVHHVPKTTAARELSELVAAETGTVSREKSRTAQFAAHPSDAASAV